MGNGQGLKDQWGVTDPAKVGSDKQAQEFKACFQSEIAAISGHLQYTSANAEAARHDPLAARRDALYPAFQAALSQIDRTNPAKAKGAIDKVLADAKALKVEVAKFHQEAQKARNDWQARQPKFDAALHQVEELESWGDAKGQSLRGLVDGIRTQTNDRKFAQACTVLDQLLPKLKPLYEDYQKQKAAKPKYDQTLAEQTAKLEALKPAERPSQPMTAKVGEADAALGQARAKADAKDYVGGLEQMKAVLTAVTALDKLAKDPQRVKFLADRKVAEEQVKTATDTTFKSVEADRTAILQLKDQSDPVADSGDYAGANKMLNDLKAKLTAFQKKVEELKKQKQAYDDALAPLQPKLTSVSQSRFKKLEPMQQELRTVQQQMETAAQNEDYVQALKLSKDVSAKVDALAPALEELDQQQKEYEDALKGFQPQLDEALKSTYKPLEPKLTEITTLKGQMEASAQSEDFVAALNTANELKGKIDAFLPELKKLQKAEDDYKKSRTALQPKLDDALVSARDFAPLKAARAAIISGDSAVEAAATAQDFEKALESLKDLETKVDAYLKDAKTEEEKYKKKGDDLTKKLDDASYFTRDNVARDEVSKLTPDELQHLPTPIRNRLLQELQEGNFSDEDKEACKKLYSVKFTDPQFEKIDDAGRKKMIEKIKTDPAFKHARDNWDKLPEKERIEVMQKAVDYQADAYGIPKTTIATYSEDDATDYGYYRHSDGKLHVNVHDSALKNGGFDEAIDTAVHENGHRYQHTLIDKLDKGEIKEGDPLYNQAMTFKLNDGYYVQPVKKGKSPTPNTGPEYFTQPMENHSRITGSAVKSAGIGK